MQGFNPGSIHWLIFVLLRLKIIIEKFEKNNNLSIDFLLLFRRNIP